MSRPLYVQLGRVGDILNLLPVAEEEYRRSGERPMFMVAKDFAGVLDGISYVEPVIFEDRFENVIGAMFQARKLTDRVILGQIYGRGICRVPECTSFCRESWSSANAPAPWGSLPLTFDRRDYARELKLVRSLPLDPRRDLVLLALGGTSSPFPQANALRLELSRRLSPQYQILDLTEIRAERIYDLLGLFEMAYCLVTTDSAPLHLAAAVPTLPVVALVTRWPSEWHGTPWRPQHVARHFYDEFPAALPEIPPAVESARDCRSRRIIHAWAPFRPEEKPDPETVRRLAVAENSWTVESYGTGLWVGCPFEAHFSRRSSGDLGDPRPMPYLRDLIDQAVGVSRDGRDIIAFTNSDVCFAPGLTGQIIEKVDRYGAAFTHRWDFPRISVPFISEAMVRRGIWYPGSDAFFFTVDWWLTHALEYPDMILGREQSDEILRQLIKLHAGPQAEIEAGIYHEKHKSFWEDPANRDSNPGNIHNRKLAAEWFTRTGLRENDWQWWTVQTNRKTI